MQKTATDAPRRAMRLQIDLYYRWKLFKPFSTTKKGGLGVGLAQCRGIVEAHGGTIDARSRPGEGTVFTVRVPAGSAQPPEGA